MAQRCFFDLSETQLQSYLDSIQERPFRSAQIREWVYRKAVTDFSLMKNLSETLRQKLAEAFYFPVMDLAASTGNSSGTRKFVFQVNDGQKIESVLIPVQDRMTVCVSSQAGCRFACRFCASGVGGWTRNLSRGEVMMQVLRLRQLGGQRISHVVFMGTGEPLDNWDEVREAIVLLNHPQAMGIAARRITVSTCGLIPGIRQLSQLGLQIELAVSLHGYDDESRGRLMPINRTYPLNELIRACREYVEKTKRQITFEYILIDGVTCREQAPGVLASLLKGLECKLNLIPYNQVNEFEWEAPSRNVVYRFRDALISQGVHATIRWSRGSDVQGACGQLRRQ